MAVKMDLILAGPAGHILAAAVRQNTSGPQPDAAALVGEGLMVRDPISGDTQLTIAPQHLTVQSVDLRDDVLLTARKFVLVDNLPEVGGDPAANPVQLNGAQITVNIPDAAPDGGTTVWIYIEGPPQPVIQQVQVPEFTKTGSEPLPLPAGNYRVLVLAPGCRAEIVEEPVP